MLAVRSESWLRLALWLFSLLSGMGAAAVLLRYEGERLINISAFLGVLVGGQLLALIGLGAFQVIFRHRPAGLQRWIMPASLRQARLLYSFSAWRWRVFADVQTGGLFFNLGVVLATLGKVVTQDLAFGWATTLQVNGEDIHRLVRTLSAPWGGWATPTAEQIDQSRIVLKDGLASIDAASTASWWPFLILCVLVYGALPRMVLALAGQWRQHICLRYPPFHHPGARRLTLSLTREPLRFQTGDENTPQAATPGSADLAALQPQGTLDVRFAEPVLDPEARTAWISRTAQSLGCTLSESTDEASGSLWVVEAWQPPLEESLRHLRELRSEWGPDADLIVLLVGEPAENSFAKPDPEDVQVWKNRLAELGDPRLGVIAWEGA
jgi:hypothetical protein